MECHVCPSCGSGEVVEQGPIPAGYTFAGRRLHTPMGAARQYRCPTCRLGFRWPQPSESELTELYQLAEADPWTYTPSERPDWVLALRTIEKSAVSRVLDVGCFDGAFLGMLPLRTEKYGVEISQPAADRARKAGISILGGTLQNLAEEPFDAVVAFDVIEHVRDPEEFLHDMAVLTKPGGLVIISTGNLDSLSWRFMGSRYWYSSLPEHLSFTSPSWAKLVGHRCGLELRSVALFSHAASRGPALRAAEAAKNLIFRASPNFFDKLRGLGFGSREIADHPALLKTPPIWITARDQYIAVFERSPEALGDNRPS